MKPRVYFIIGPTAIGKSEAAVSLAKKIDAEIISCDSMQVYKGMGIISSQPSARSRKAIKHHLVAMIAPAKEYNSARYRKEALKKIKQVIARGRTPLFVGGTGLYMSILVDGIFKAKSENKVIRARLYREAQKKGSGFLHKKLEEADPVAAKKIHPNDTRRIVRALEVFETTGRRMSELQKERKGLADEFEVRQFCLNMPRELLYQRIDKRTDVMFRQGLVKEVRKLLKLKLSKTSSCAIGIKELSQYFSGKLSLDEAKQLMQKNTRNYAKRQLTWFRKDKRIIWVGVEEDDTPAEISQKILHLLD